MQIERGKFDRCKRCMPIGICNAATRCKTIFCNALQRLATLPRKARNHAAFQLSIFFATPCNARVNVNIKKLNVNKYFLQRFRKMEKMPESLMYQGLSAVKGRKRQFAGRGRGKNLLQRLASARGKNSLPLQTVFYVGAAS